MVTDGHHFNQKVFESLNASGNSPWLRSCSMFLLYDYIHLLSLLETIGSLKNVGNCNSDIKGKAILLSGMTENSFIYLSEKIYFDCPS